MALFFLLDFRLFLKLLEEQGRSLLAGDMQIVESKLL